MKRRTEAGEGEEALLLLVAVLGILGLAGWGGYKLFEEWRGPSTDCYYYSHGGPQLCVAYRAPPGDCVAYAQATQFLSATVACFDDGRAEKAAEFVKNSGKKICGQFAIRVNCSGAPRAAAPTTPLPKTNPQATPLDWNTPPTAEEIAAARAPEHKLTDAELDALIAESNARPGSGAKMPSKAEPFREIYAGSPLRDSFVPDEEAVESPPPVSTSATFERGTRRELTQAELKAMWEEATPIKSEPGVEIRDSAK